MRRDKSGLLPKHNTRPTRWAEYTALYSADTETKKKRDTGIKQTGNPLTKLQFNFPGARCQ